MTRNMLLATTLSIFFVLGELFGFGPRTEGIDDPWLPPPPPPTPIGCTIHGCNGHHGGSNGPKIKYWFKWGDTSIDGLEIND